MKTEYLLLFSVIGALVMTNAAVAFAHDDQIAQLRQATARFQHISAAMAEGYAQFLGCISQPDEGGMGIHFVNGNFVGDTVLDPLRPEALVYEPLPHGGLRLVALEYIVFAEAWDKEHHAPPSLLGQTFSLVGSPNRYGIPAFYELHVWAWKQNPSGLFNDWNPRVSCGD